MSGGFSSAVGCVDEPTVCFYHVINHATLAPCSFATAVPELPWQHRQQATGLTCVHERERSRYPG